MRLVLVLGEGAIGKHSFINKMKEMTPLQREKYGINTQNVKYITFTNGNKLYYLLKDKEIETEGYDCIVFKWQISIGAFKMLKENINYTEVIGLMLDVDPKIKKERQSKKHPQIKSAEQHDFAAYARKTDDKLKEMRNGYDSYIVVDGNNDKYNVTYAE